MSYRNNHDAALMRVDALEAELARLRLPRPAKVDRPAKPLPWSKLAFAGAAVGFVAFAAKVTSVALQTTPMAPMIEPSAPAAAVPRQARSLRACIADIAKVNGVVDETSTDPRHGASPVSWIPRTGAGCRDEIADVAASATLPDDLRTQLGRWSTAEDALAGRISLIVVYYGSDPYALDNYATAAQLWREYHQAHDARDHVLRDLAPALDRDPM